MRGLGSVELGVTVPGKEGVKEEVVELVLADDREWARR